MGGNCERTHATGTHITSLNTRTRLSDPTPSVVLPVPRQSCKVVILDTVLPRSSGKALRHKISHFFDFLPPAAGGTSTPLLVGAAGVKADDGLAFLFLDRAFGQK